MTNVSRLSLHFVVSVAHAYFTGVLLSNGISFSNLFLQMIDGHYSQVFSILYCALSLMSLTTFIILKVFESRDVQRKCFPTFSLSYLLIDVFAIRDLLILFWLFLHGSLFSLANLLFITRLINGIQFDLSFLVGYLCVPIMIGLILSMRLLPPGLILKSMAVGVFLTLLILVPVVLATSYPLPRLLDEISKQREISPGHLALRRFMVARRLELSSSVLYCEKDRLLCKAQKDILGIRESGTEMYVHPSQQGLKGPRRYSVDEFWQDSPEKIGSSLESKFPLRDNNFQSFGRRSLLYNTSVNMIEKEYLLLGKDEYSRLQEYYNRSVTQGVSVPVKEKYPLIFDDEHLLECLATTNVTERPTWKECGIHTTEYQLKRADVFAYVDPFSKKKTKLRDMSIAWSDGLGMMRRFLVECETRFDYYDTEVQLSVDCLEGRGIGRELEFLQVMKTFGLPTWIFHSLGLIFIGVLRFEEIERILVLNGSEQHPNIRIKLQ